MTDTSHPTSASRRPVAGLVAVFRSLLLLLPLADCCDPAIGDAR